MLPLEKLSSEVKSLLKRGIWSIYHVADPAFPAAAYLVMTEEKDKFLLSTNGLVVGHDAAYNPPHELEQAHPFREELAEAFKNLMARLEKQD